MLILQDLIVPLAKQSDKLLKVTELSFQRSKTENLALN